MNKVRAIALLVMLLALTACNHAGEYLDVAKDKGISKAYFEVLNHWTRKETLYSQFETKVQITATFKNTDFSRAYNAEYARLYYLTEAEKKRMDDMQAGFTRDFREVFFYAAMARKDMNDFAQANSIWTVFLSDEKGNQIKPLDIRKIEKVTPVMEEFFPYINKYYGNCYSLKFPPTPDASKPMKIVFTSMVGKLEISWP